jgi:hypothetical protein
MLKQPTELPPIDDVAYLLARAATPGLIRSPGGVDEVVPKLLRSCGLSCVPGSPVQYIVQQTAENGG